MSVEQYKAGVKRRLKLMYSQLHCVYNWVRQRPPLVTVVITCYNHAHYLPDAIESIYAQTWEPLSLLAQRWSPIEIIVVDDGSVDDSRAVTEQYPNVRYVYQTNQGLSAARNTGIRHSRGNFLVFLDADDWLYPRAVATGLDLLLKHPNVVFVSGGSDKVNNQKKILSEKNSHVADGHYQRMLEENYVGMHATVMYRREILESYTFDCSLKSCEDYDMYLRITRDHSVLHHNQKVAAYRIHDTNMSANIPVMLQSALSVLDKQKGKLRSEAELAAYERGRQNWTDYYATQAEKRLRGE